MVSDLSKVPKEKFELVESSKGSYYKASYKLEMRFEAMITFRLRYDGGCLPFLVSYEIYALVIVNSWLSLHIISVCKIADGFKL